MSNTFHYSHTVAGSRLADEDAAVIWRLTHVVRDARDNLDAQPIVDRLDEDAVYEAQAVEEPLVGKAAVGEYLRKRFAFFREARETGRDIGQLRLGTIDLPAASEHPCLIFEMGGQRHAIWVIKPTSDHLISRIDILTVAPAPAEAKLL